MRVQIWGTSNSAYMCPLLVTLGSFWAGSGGEAAVMLGPFPFVRSPFLPGTVSPGLRELSFVDFSSCDVNISLTCSFSH